MDNSHRSSFENVLTSKSIADAFWLRAASHPEAPLYRYALASGPNATRVWRTDTYASATPAIARIAHYLSSLGVKQGTAVAIISNTRPEWMLADMAIQTLGGITVSIYQSLPAAEVGFILYDSGAKIVFIENEEQAQKIAWLRHNRCPIPERESTQAGDERVSIESVITFEKAECLSDARSCTDIVSDNTLSQNPPPIPDTLTRASVASYVYTSGTTGPPKGVVQTHGNHLSNVEQTSESGVFLLNGTLFLYLPLAHSFARLAHYIGFLTTASLILPAVIDHHTSKLDLSSIARDIREGNPSVLPSVPRLLEKIASALKARAEGSTFQSRILRLCLRNAHRIQHHKDNGTRPGLLDEVLYQGLSSVRSKIKHQLFGQQFHHAISGGAKLDPEVNRFFESLEILVCEGYGLTETCVATHVNLPTKRKIGSVGTALRRIETQISPSDGEIYLRGPNITQGYLNRPQATHDSWGADGWFHTGDIGHVDEDGFLFITDRKKEIVITAGGKKIAPTLVEGMVKRNSFISQAFFYGDEKPYCVMLITLNEIELKALLQSKGVQLAANQKLSTVPQAITMVDEAVRLVNEQLASYETIKKHAILDEDFSVENGLLTPTLKMKRKMIAQKNARVIESLYETHGVVQVP